MTPERRDEYHRTIAMLRRCAEGQGDVAPTSALPLRLRVASVLGQDGAGCWQRLIVALGPDGFCAVHSDHRHQPGYMCGTYAPSAVCVCGRFKLAWHYSAPPAHGHVLWMPELLETR